MVEMPIVNCNSCAIGLSCADSCAFVRTSRPAGWILFHQGDRPQAAHFMRRGLVLMTEYDAKGDLVHQRLQPPGSLLDMEAAVSGRPHHATAAAETDIEVCTLALSSFHAWLGPKKAPARALLELALEEARTAEWQISEARQSAVSRVAHFLLSHGGEPGRPLELQHQLVAGLLGLRPETFSRVLSRLRKSGAIEGGRRVSVCDRVALAEIARQDAGSEER
ncbi:MAG: Crp/Fnr family transcriptional regulator [Myxococcales bacterium]